MAESKVMNMDYMKNYQDWINSVIIDSQSKFELLELHTNESEIKERFYKNLEFGTGGIRGIIGAGTNRINVYTVRKATQGLAKFINSSNSNKDIKSVVIAYDSRHFSSEFAEEAALVLSANNIKAYVFSSLKSTPQLSFAVRYLNCEAGIVITASHNPPEYNGYKVYGSDGGQITLESANAIINEIDKLDIFDDVNICTKEYAIKRELFSYIGENVDIEYLNRVTGLSINPSISKKVENFKIVYTPLHGAGLIPIEKALTMLGYNLNIVENQKKPDGNFPTVKSPNPEEREALNEGIRLAKKINADIVLGTDPDSDRVGVAVLSKEGNYELLTGNQIGALLTYYIVTNKKDINSRDAVIKTIVTSELGADIAKSYGATVFDTLTGFKFIGEKIKEFTVKGNYDFLFGYEESYGYLAGTFVRDKDAIISSVLIVEMTAFYKVQGLTLLDVLARIYKQYGHYVDSLESFTFEGIEGQEKIKSIVDKFRNTKELLELFSNIIMIEDFELQKKYNIQTDQYIEIGLPSSNVIKIHLSDGSWFAVRPSGTEPKIKVYYSIYGSNKEEVSSSFTDITSRVNNFIKIANN